MADAGAHDPGAAYKDPKQEKDLSEVADRAIASAANYAAANDLENATNVILMVEKECRNVVDGASASRACVWLLQTLFDRHLVTEGCEWLITASKKRSQLKRVQKTLVLEAMQYLEKWLPDPERRAAVYEVIETICKVTDGKIFLELERARTILRLSGLKEAEGDINAAANVLQEVQVESNIYMDKLEKGAYIIEQMRLVILKGDWVRCQIISKKLNKATLSSEGFELLKLKYYVYMAQYHNHELTGADVAGRSLAECYLSSLDTDFSKLDVEALKSQLADHLPANSEWDITGLKLWYLSSYLICLALSQESAEKIKSLQQLLRTHELVLRDHDMLRACAEQLTDWDVTYYAPPSSVESIMKHPLLADDTILPGSERRRELLRDAYLRHNLVVISRFYLRSDLDLISQLTGFSREEVEEQLCALIRNGNIKAKINRPTAVVVFKQKNEEHAINDWSHSICQTLDALSEACNLIEKERFIHLAQS